MNALVVCPECKRKWKVPESAAGKTIRCPACQATIPVVKGTQPKGSETTPCEPLEHEGVTTAPANPPPAVLPRKRELEREEFAEGEPRRTKKPIRKGTPIGLILGLIGGCVLLFLVLVGGGVGLLVYFALNKTIPEAEWQPFPPPNSGCTILMPGTPVPEMSNMLGITMTQYQVERKKENAVFVVAFFDLPPRLLRPNVLEDITNGSRNGALARMNGGKVTSETSISLGNLPGREYQIKPPTRGTFIVRVYLAKVGNTHRVYIVMAGGDSIQPNKGDAVRFFDSFQIAAPASPPALGGGPMAQVQQPPAANPPVVNRPRPNLVPPFQRQPRPRPVRRPNQTVQAGERAVWNETSGTQTIALAFAPDSAILAVGHWDKKLRLWDVLGGRDRQLIQVNDRTVRAVAFSLDGSTLASGGDDGKVILWDPAAGKERSRFQVMHARPKDKYYVTALRFGPDGKTLSVAIRPWGNANAEVHLWDVENNKERAVFRDCKEEIKKLAFTSDGAVVILMPNSVRVWDSAANQVRREFKAANPVEQFITSAVSPDGQTLATLGDDKKLKLWRLSDGSCLQTWPVKADVIRQIYFPLEFSPDGKYLGLGARGPNLHLWDAGSGKELKVTKVGASSGFIDVLAFSPDGRLLACHSSNGPKIFEVATWQPASNAKALSRERQRRNSSPGRLTSGLISPPRCPVSSRRWPVPQHR